jgi:hypothetical protein
MNRKSMLTALAATCLTIGVAYAEHRRFQNGQHIGTWITVEGLIPNDGSPWTNGILSKSKTMGYGGCYPNDDEHCALAFQIQCTTGNHYELFFLAPCPTCGRHVARQTDVRVNLSPGTYGFNVPAVSDDAGFVTAQLNQDQVAQISKTEWDAIGLMVQGGPYIYTPISGTAKAIAALADVCSP